MFHAYHTSPSQTFDCLSPSTGQSVSRVAAQSVSESVAIAEIAAKSFINWSKVGPSVRRDLLLKAASLLETKADQFMDCMISETGTSRLWAQFNIRGSISALKEAASLTTQVAGNTVPSDQPGSLSLTLRVPAGVVLGIAPWNAPLLLGLRAIAMPLACGNTVILKASEACPGTHWLIGELFREAGAPEGVVNVVTHRNEDAAVIVEALIAHPSIRRVNFTGSTKVGRIIGQLAGKHLKPALLELGGKSPLVILEDADLDQAVAAASFGAFMNAGQICMSTERIVVDEKIADRFSDELAKKAIAMSLDGGLISCSAADNVQALIDDAVQKGAKLLTPLKRAGNSFSPVVIDHVKPGMKVYGDESFGPIAPIVRVSDANEAVNVANDTEYGLAAAVFGRDLSRTIDVAQRIECGVCHINAPTVKSEPQLPFGGVKASGFGRFGGTAAIQEFTELRTLTIQTQAQKFPI